MKLNFQGAAQTVTGSKTLLKHHGYNSLIDCGLYQGPRPMRDSNWQTPNYLNELESICLTHAHIDHSGLLPRWYALGWRGPIYCTPSTHELLKIMLPDSGRLQEEDAVYANRSKYTKHSPALPLYTEKDAKNVLNQIQDVNFNEAFSLHKDLGLKFYRAGHILGSSVLQFTYSDGHNSRHLVFSGDLGGGKSEVIKEPITGLEADYLVLESTYGGRKIEADQRYDQLKEIVNRVIQRGGSLFIPAFAVGRTQDILTCLFNLFQHNQIPDVPIYLDSPMANSVTQLYLKNKSELQIEFREGAEQAFTRRFFTPVESLDESIRIQNSTEPKIVIAASGMLQGGRILHHLKEALPKPQNAVLFIGHQSKDSKGRLLKEGIESLRIHHQEIPVNAEIISIEGFSAHADSEALKTWVASFKKAPKKIFLNHGEIDQQLLLKADLEKEFESEIIIPEVGQEFTL